MNLVPWRRASERAETTVPPETSLSRLRNEMELLFDRFFRDPWGWPGGSAWLAGLTAVPRTDVAESDRDVTVTMALPGVDPNQILIDIGGGALTVRGEKRQQREHQQRNHHSVERHYGSFRRTVPLPSSVAPDRVEATCKDGVLTITIQKTPAAQPKRIPLKTP